MPDINLTDISFNKDNTQNYHLSIQADLNGFSFCILDADKKKYVALRHYRIKDIYSIDDYTDKLVKVFDDDDLLDQDYGSVSFIYQTQKSILIPESFFDKSNLKSYFEFNHTISELDEINYNFLSDINAFNVFAIPSYIANEVIKRYRDAKLYHQATPFIRSIFRKYAGDENDSVYVSLNNRFIDIAVAGKNKLKLYNTFQFHNETDLLYFVLYVYKQLNIDTRSNQLFVSGELSDNQHIFRSLKRFINNVHYLESFDFIFSGALARLNKHKYFNLFNLVSCE